MAQRVIRGEFERNDGPARRTPQGGLAPRAFLTRTGIFVYRKADGTTTRELRHPDEVFNADSLATLPGAPLTVFHPGKVTPATYRAVSVGHVADDVRADGNKVAATIRVQDAEAVKSVEDGALVELSCGYTCEVDETAGEYEGQKYDAVQRNIKYNHVALLPKNGGRAGAEVRLHLDAGDAEEVEDDVVPPVDLTPVLDAITELTSKVDSYSSRMSLEEQLAKAVADLAKAQADLAAAQGRSDSLTSDLETERASIDSRVDARVELVSSAKRFMGSDFTGKGLTDAQIMSAALAKHSPDFKSDGKEASYLRGRFEAACESAVKAEAQRADAAKILNSNGAPAGDPIAEARARMEKESGKK